MSARLSTVCSLRGRSTRCLGLLASATLLAFAAPAAAQSADAPAHRAHARPAKKLRKYGPAAGQAAEDAKPAEPVKAAVSGKDGKPVEPAEAAPAAAPSEPPPPPSFDPREGQRVHEELERSGDIHPAVEQHQFRRSRARPASDVVAQAANGEKP